MRYKRTFFENIVAEVIARFIIGVVFGGFVAVQILPEIAMFWNDEDWKIFLVPLAAGVLAAIFGVRKGTELT